MNEQAGLWRPEAGGRSAGWTPRPSLRRRAPNNSCNCQRRPSMHHRSFDKQRIEWKGEIEDMRITVSFCRVHLDLESQKPWHDVRMKR